MLGGSTRKAVRGVLLDLDATAQEREEAILQALEGVAEYARYNHPLKPMEFQRLARKAWARIRAAR